MTATNKSKCKRCHVTEHTVSFVVFVNMFIHPTCHVYDVMLFVLSGKSDLPQRRSCLSCTVIGKSSTSHSVIIRSSSSSIRVLGARRPTRNRETRHLGARRPTQVKSTLLTLALGGTSAIQAHRGSAAWEHVGNPSAEMMID